MNKKLMTKWADALRNGSYDQCQGVLRKGCHYCATAVGADIIPGVEWEIDDDYDDDGNPLGDYIPIVEPEILAPVYYPIWKYGMGANDVIVYHMGISEDDVGHVMSLNDDWEFKFADIARDMDVFIETGTWPDPYADSQD